MAEKPTYEELERRVQELEKIESKYTSSKKALQENESLFKMLYEKAPLGYQSLDENGHFIVVNKTWLDALGYAKEEVIGKSFADFLHPDWRDHFKENFPRFKSIGEILGVEFEMVKKNGGLILVSFTGKISRDEKGNFQQTHCIFHDITDRKKHEELLERYKNIVSSTTDAIAYLDENYRYTIVNNAYEDFSGSKQDDLVGMTVSEYMGKDVFDEKIKSSLDRCLNGETVNYQEWFEYPTKGIRFVDVTYYPYRDRGNHISGVIANTRDITERKKVEEALNREHMMLARAEALAHVGSWEWEAEGDKVTWSEELFRIFGLEPMAEAPPFTEHQAFFVPEDRVRLVEAVEECLRNNVPYDLEVRITRTDGQLRHCVVRGIPEQDTDGTVNRLYGSLHDITERKQGEEALRESEEKYRLLFEHTGESLFVAQNGRIVLHNPRTVELTGYSTDELQSRSFIEFIHENDREMVSDRHLQRLKGENPPARYAFRIIHKSGHIRWVELNAVMIHWSGKPATLCFLTDITEHKQAEESLNKYAKDLEKSNFFIQTILDNLPIGLAVNFIEEGTATYINNKFEEIYGWPKEQLKNIGEFFHKVYPDPEYREKLMNQVFEDIKSGDPERMVWEGIEITRENGEKRIISAKNIALYEQNLMISTVQDITENKTLQAQLSQAQKLESVGRLAGGVAHDFNNMLGVILGHVDFALERAEGNLDQSADLKEIKKAAQRSADLTKQLLAFARKQTISPTQLDLNDTVESMLNMLRRLIGENIDLIWKPSAHLWPVKMDPSQIDQILANLCINARDAISGVGKLTIETGKKSFDEEYCRQHSGFTAGDFILLAVSDNGCGMVKNTLENLFEPFFTTKDVGQGTGLGLATVYGIIKQNNGFINVYSEPGQGSTFNIYLPRFSADKDTDKAVPEKKAAAGGTETILLVEDEPSILRMTRMMLERKGYSVLSAATPVEAVEKAKAHSGSIDLLMTDVVMPEMNGRDLAEQITGLYPDIRLLFMSGYTSNVIAHHGVLDDGVAFIQKPFSMADMTIKVREILDEALHI